MGCPKLTYHPEFLHLVKETAIEKSDHVNFLPLGEKNVGKENCIDYYPFGAVSSSYKRENSLSNDRLYQTKEYQDELGLNWYDFGPRQYDPWGVFTTTQDPLAEEFYSYSPYSWAVGNPMRFIDPSGMAAMDITLLGANNSSVTIETDLVDISVDASGLGVDFGGNYSIGGSDVVHAALDIAGVVDPTGVADAANASLYAAEGGSIGDVLISAAGVIPYAGDLAKVGRLGKAVDKVGDAIKLADKANDAKKGAKATDIVTHAGQKVDPKTGQKIGPSGKPMVHTVQHGTKKEAKDAARQGGKGTPVKHTKDQKGGKHYHHGDGKQGKGKGTKDYGSKSGKRSDNVHHEYPD
jgi:RHS repeat-associated protein